MITTERTLIMDALSTLIRREHALSAHENAERDADNARRTLAASDTHERVPAPERSRKLSTSTRQRYSVRTRPHSRHVVSVVPLNAQEQLGAALFGCSCMDADSLYDTRDDAQNAARGHLHSAWTPRRVARTVRTREQRIAEHLSYARTQDDALDIETAKRGTDRIMQSTLTDHVERRVAGQRVMFVARMLS